MSSNGSKNETKSSASSVKNAWSKPLQPKSAVTPPPGMGGNSKALAGTGASSSSGTANSSTRGGSSTSNPSSIVLTEAQAALRERFISLMVLATGQSITATLVDGTKLEAVMSAATPFPVQEEQHRFKYVFKQVLVLEKGTKFKFEKGATVILNMADVVNVVIKHLPLDAPLKEKTPSAASASLAGSFRTDAEISAAAGAGKGKVLEAAGSAWTGGAAAAATATSLQSHGPSRNSRAEALMGMSSAATSSSVPSGPLKGSIGGWDQFEANKTLFNVNATYDENLYTTSLDKSKMDAQQIRQAEKLAKEIESQTTTNIHLAEERGLKLETDYDEEDLYSGVIKSTEQKLDEPAQATKKDTAAPKMNYAAAAAKQTMPPGFAAGNKQPQTPTRPDAKMEHGKPTPATTDIDKSAEETKASSEKTAAPTKAEEEGSKETPVAPEKSSDDTNKASAPVSKPKLNPNAKEFSLNISAKPFTPSFVAEPIPVVPQPQMPYAAFDPITGMSMPIDPNMMHAHPYMQHGAPMGHPGMMGMMGQQYLGVRYPGQFPMDTQQPHMIPGAPGPHVPQPPQQPGPPVPNSAHTSGAPSPMTTSEDDSQQVTDALLDGESQTSSQAPPQIQMQQQPSAQPGMPTMPYGAPANYYGQMPMHPPQHGAPYPPQPYGVPQQMPGGPMYRQGYPMPQQMAPNMIRPYPYGPGVPYQQYGYDEVDGYRGGRGRGRGGRGAGAGGRGNGRNNNRSNMNGRGGRSQPNQPHGDSTTSSHEEARDGADISATGPSSAPDASEIPPAAADITPQQS